MKDEILSQNLNKIECGIINLQSSNDGNGTHWVCYYKKNKITYFFDSFGMCPPIELASYLNNNFEYNSTQIQDYNDPPFCGHLCIFVLKKLVDGNNFDDIISELKLIKNTKKLTLFLINFFFNK